MVAGFNFILALLILVCELLSFFDCAVDFILGQVGGGSDGDVLFIARADPLRLHERCRLHRYQR
mgnify:CR=1 FL=1